MNKTLAVLLTRRRDRIDNILKLMEDPAALSLEAAS